MPHAAVKFAQEIFKHVIGPLSRRVATVNPEVIADGRRDKTLPGLEVTHSQHGGEYVRGPDRVRIPEHRDRDAFLSGDLLQEIPSFTAVIRISLRTVLSCRCQKTEFTHYTLLLYRL